MRLPVAALLLRLLLEPARPAWACSCVAGVPEQEYADRAAAVFVGTVVAEEPPPTVLELGRDGLVGSRLLSPWTTWTFVVEAVEKGDPGSRARVHSGTNCAEGFLPHRRYRVFAYADEEGYGTSKCVPNRDLGWRMLPPVAPGVLAPTLLVEWPFLTLALLGALVFGAAYAATARDQRRR